MSNRPMKIIAEDTFLEIYNDKALYDLTIEEILDKVPNLLEQTKGSREEMDILTSRVELLTNQVNEYIKQVEEVYKKGQIKAKKDIIPKANKGFSIFEYNGKKYQVVEWPYEVIKE